MTSPTSVGSVSVEILAEAKSLARSMKAEVEKAFRGLDVQADIDRAVGRADVRVPVQADFDGAGLASRLQAAVAAASARSRATVNVDVEVDRQGGLARLGSMLRGLGSSGGGVAGLASQFEGLSGAIQRSVGSSAQLGGSLAGAVTTAAGPIGTIISLLAVAVGSMGALAAAAVAAVPAIAAVAGAAAAIPGALAGAGAAFGALALGFAGISDAFKPAAGGGGGGGGGGAAGQGRQIAAAARQVEAARRGIAAANRQVEASERSLAAAHRGVEAAELRLADAQKRARQAQQAISRARDEARESIEDLNRSLRGAKLSEEEAALGVTDALRELEQVKLTGNIPDIQRADIAYRQALQTLEESRDTTEDLQKETAEANRKGVEGSDQVQDAYRDQEEALRAVKDAQIGIIEANDSLKSAQDGVKAAMDGVKSAADGLTSAQEALAQSQTKVASGGGGVAQQLTKLAPAAQKFVAAVKALKPAFEALRLDVQQRLFEGLDKTVTNLGQEWIPRLRKNLGEYATVFNGFFKDLGSSLTDQEFMADISVGLDGFRRGLDNLLDSISQKLVPALGDLVEASAPFTEALLSGLGKVVTKFSDWVQAGEKSGALKDFFERATAALKEIGRIGKSAVRIIGNFIEIITGAQSKDSSDSPLEKFRRGLDRVADWLDDPKNQEQIRGWIDDVGLLAVEFGKSASEINRFLKELGIGGSEQGGSAGEDIGRAIISGMLAGLWGAYKETMSVFLDRIFLGGIIGQVKDIFGIKSPSTVFAEIGRNLVRGLIGGVSSWFGQLRTKASEIKTHIMNRLAGAREWLVQTGRNVVSGMGSGISGLYQWLRDKASALKTRVTGAVAGAGNWLVGTGKNVIYGLWNGISSLGGWLWNKVVSFANNYVSNAIQNALGINSPSKVAAALGRGVPEGLALGINKDANLVEAAAERLAAAALPQLQDATLGLGWDADAAITRSLSASAEQRLLVSWKTGSSGSRLLDEIARMIDLEYRGDVSAALSRTSR